MERHRRRGFTLIELLIFSAIFSLIIGTFITILVSVVDVQVSQSASAEVAQQGQFLEQQIQYYVQGARLVDMPVDTAQGSLRLRESASSSDPTSIMLSAAPGNQPQLVQTSTAQITTAATSISVTFPGSVTSGDVVAFGAQWWAPSVSLVNVSSSCVSGGLTITNATSVPGLEGLAQGYGMISGYGGCTITAFFSGSVPEASIVVHEISGVDKTNPLDGSALTQNGFVASGTLQSSPGINTLVGGDYIWGIAFDGQGRGVTWTPGINFTERAYIYSAFETEDTIQQIPGTEFVTITPNNNSTYLTLGIMAFRAASIGLYIQQGAGGAFQSLTSGVAKVTNLMFTRHYNLAGESTPYGVDSVSYSFTLSKDTGNQTYSQTFQSSAAVSAPVPKIALIQQASAAAAGTGITNVSASYPGDNEHGDLLVAVVSNTGNASATVSLSDTAGNFWKEAASSTYAAYGQETSIFYAPDSWNSPNTVSATFSAGVTSPSIFIYEYRGSSAATALVQQAAEGFNQYGNGNTPVFFSLANNVTAGNVLSFNMQWATTSTLAAVTSPCVSGGNFTLVDTSYPSGWLSSAQGYGVVSTSGPCTIAASFTPAVYQFAGVIIQEISGVNTSTPIDGHLLTWNGYTNISNSGNITTTQGGDYIVGSGIVDSGTGATGTPELGFTIINPNPENIQVENTTQLSAGTIAATFTFPSPTQLSGGIMAFRSISGESTAPFDTVASQTQSNSTISSSGLTSPNSAVELLIGVSYVNPSVGTMVPGSGFTVETSSTVSGTYVEDKNVYVASPVSADWTDSSAASSSAMIVTFH